MALVSFLRIKQVFGGSLMSDTERDGLFREALLLTLSRATSSDARIEPVEVQKVQKIMQAAIGEEVSEADIRVAAASELYESAPLDRYLGVVGRVLGPAERSTITKSLAEVIRSDRRVSPKEVDFFNRVANALGASHAEVAGLFESD